MNAEIITFIRDSLKDLKDEVKSVKQEIGFLEQKIDDLAEKRIKPLETAKVRLIAILMTIAFGSGAAGNTMTKFIFKNDDEIIKNLEKNTKGE